MGYMSCLASLIGHHVSIVIKRGRSQELELAYLDWKDCRALKVDFQLSSLAMKPGSRARPGSRSSLAPDHTRQNISRLTLNKKC